MPCRGATLIMLLVSNGLLKRYHLPLAQFRRRETCKCARGVHGRQTAILGNRFEGGGAAEITKTRYLGSGGQKPNPPDISNDLF